MNRPVPDPQVVVIEEHDALASLLVASIRGGGLNCTRMTGFRSQVEHVGSVVVLGPTECRASCGPDVSDLVQLGHRVLVTSGDAFNRDAAALLLAGASGFLVIEGVWEADLLPEAVRTVAAGASALHPEVAAEVLRQWRSTRSRPSESSGSTKVTPREREVLLGMRDGLTTRMLAARLGIAEKTIEAHKSRLYARIGARSQTHAIRLGQELGLI